MVPLLTRLTRLQVMNLRGCAFPWLSSRAVWDLRPISAAREGKRRASATRFVELIVRQGTEVALTVQPILQGRRLRFLREDPPPQQILLGDIMFLALKHE